MAALLRKQGSPTVWDEGALAVPPSVPDQTSVRFVLRCTGRAHVARRWYPLRAPAGSHLTRLSCHDALRGSVSASLRGVDDSARRMSSGLERVLERLPDLALDVGLGAPTLVDAARDDLTLLSVDERDVLQHRETVVPLLVVSPLQDPLACLREALVDPVDDEVLAGR